MATLRSITTTQTASSNQLTQTPQLPAALAQSFPQSLGFGPDPVWPCWDVVSREPGNGEVWYGSSGESRLKRAGGKPRFPTNGRSPARRVTPFPIRQVEDAFKLNHPGPATPLDRNMTIVSLDHTQSNKQCMQAKYIQDYIHVRALSAR